jgi:hypothetical protein
MKWKVSHVCESDKCYGIVIFIHHTFALKYEGHSVPQVPKLAYYFFDEL